MNAAPSAGVPVSKLNQLSHLELSTHSSKGEVQLLLRRLPEEGVTIVGCKSHQHFGHKASVPFGPNGARPDRTADTHPWALHEIVHYCICPSRSAMVNTPALRQPKFPFCGCQLGATLISMSMVILRTRTDFTLFSGNSRRSSSSLAFCGYLRYLPSLGTAEARPSPSDRVRRICPLPGCRQQRPRIE